MKNDFIDTNSYNKKGYIIIDNVYNELDGKNFCLSLAHLINSLDCNKIFIKKPEDFSFDNLRREVLSSLYELENIDHNYIKTIYDTIRDTSSIDNMLNKNIIIDSVKKILNLPDSSPLYVKQKACRIDMPNNETFSLNWHQEAHYTIKGSDLVQLWAPAIFDIDHDNGALKILESSNLEGVAETNDHVPEVGHAQYVPKENIISKYKEKEIQLKFGSILLFSKTLIHKSGVNVSKHPRLTLLCHYHNPLNKEFVYHMSSKKTEERAKNSYK